MSARVTAQGRKIVLEPVESPTGITLGGAIAEAQNADTAKEIARRCDCFEEMLEALKGLISLRNNTSADEFEAYQAMFKSEGADFWNAAEAAIAKAQGGRS